jgi:peptidoglycan/xylan/chitin deacetylase (PgdA/CDA1 family)
VIVLLHLEFWELTPPPDARRDTRFVDEYGSFAPPYRAFTQREYGNRIGVFRVLDALEGTPFKLTVATGAAALSRYPLPVRMLRERGAEFVAHGEYQTRMLTSAMTEDEERAAIDRTTAAFEDRLGTRPRGWLGPDSGESPRTPHLLAEAGYRYTLDWPNDDAPYAMTTTPPLVAVPNQIEWDDVHALWLRKIATPRWPGLVEAAAERLAAEGGRSFVLSLHPWVIGQAHRIRYLREALDRLVRIEGLWPATAGEVAARARASWRPTVAGPEPRPGDRP